MEHDETAICPHCGGEIKKKAKACQHCGSDDETGWSAETYLDGIDLPYDDTYEEIRRDEFGDERTTGASSRLWIYLTGAGVLTLILFGLGMSLLGRG